jgi:hypothetical protein
MEQKRILRVVVASPSDVQAERDALPAVINELNRGVAADRNLLLELYRWETDAYPGFHAEGPQALIDPILNIRDSHILIGIFWKRFGTPTKEARSGTEHEILRAYEAWKGSGRLHIMVYFNQRPYTPKSKEETDQWGQVLDFKSRFPEEGLWWAYNGKKEFETLVRNHLAQFIRRQPSHGPTPAGGGEGPGGAPGESARESPGGRDVLGAAGAETLGTGRVGEKGETSQAVKRPFWKSPFRERLRDSRPGRPWYATAPAALAAALVLASLCVALYYWRLSPAERAEAKIRHGIWPARSSGIPRDDFDFPPGVNPDTTQCAPPNQNLWDYPPDQWCITRDAYLLVKGPDWGVRKDLAGDEALYDFQATFTVEFLKGDDAAWAVRSRKDERCGYVFMLQREHGKGGSIRLFLNGWAYTGGGKVALGKSPRNVLDIGRVYDDDFFEITLTAKDNAFSHQVRIQNVNARDPDRPFFNRPYPVLPMADKDNHFPYGSIGFFAPEPGDEISVDDFALTVQAAPTATPF